MFTVIVQPNSGWANTRRKSSTELSFFLFDIPNWWCLIQNFRLHQNNFQDPYWNTSTLLRNKLNNTAWHTNILNTYIFADIFFLFCTKNEFYFPCSDNTPTVKTLILGKKCSSVKATQLQTKCFVLKKKTKKTHKCSKSTKKKKKITSILSGNSRQSNQKVWQISYELLQHTIEFSHYETWSLSNAVFLRLFKTF